MVWKWTKRRGRLAFCKPLQMLPPNLLFLRISSRFRSSIRPFRQRRKPKLKRLTSIRISQIWGTLSKIWATRCRCSTRTTRNRPMERGVSKLSTFPWILTADMLSLWIQTQFKTIRCLLDLTMCTVIILWHHVNGQCLQRMCTFLCLIFQSCTTLMWKREMESRWNTTNLARCKSIHKNRLLGLARPNQLL